jgi:hypothetical protein
LLAALPVVEAQLVKQAANDPKLEGLFLAASGIGRS